MSLKKIKKKIIEVKKKGFRFTEIILILHGVNLPNYIKKVNQIALQNARDKMDHMLFHYKRTGIQC